MRNLIRSVCLAVTLSVASALSIFAGPRVTVIGDSYSAYTGTEPAVAHQMVDAFLANYPYNLPGTDVTELRLMYWQRVIDQLGGSLVFNNSWSGAMVSDHSPNNVIPFIRRLDKATLLGDPDLIIVMGGANDAWTDDVLIAPNRVIDDSCYDPDQWTWGETGTLATFRPAFCYLLHTLKQQCPQAKIVVAVNDSRILSAKPWGGEVVDGAAYASSMIEIARHYGALVADCTGLEVDATGHPTASGMSLISERILEAYSSADSEYADERVAIKNLPQGFVPQPKDLGDGHWAYVFNKPAADMVVTAQKNLVLKRSLVVGGGGSGGMCFGGGGGGGGVWTSDESIEIARNLRLTITVGAGGARPNGGQTVYGGNWIYRGENGGASILQIGDAAEGRTVVSGGGGGGAWNNGVGLDGASGGGGSNSGLGGSGTPPYGHNGLQAGLATAGYSSGGGGGAGADAPNTGEGGSGVYCDITGSRACYGSGGGGHDSKSGGENAGAGSPDNYGGDAVDGFGGGGGGGGLGGLSGYDGYPGGKGGDGTVVLVFYDPPNPELPAAHVSAETSGIYSHTVEVTVDKLGENASSATVLLAYGLAGGELGAYRTVAENVSAGATVSCPMTDLPVGSYRYAVKVVNDLDKECLVEGQFQVAEVDYTDERVYIDNLPSGFVPAPKDLGDGFWAYVFDKPATDMVITVRKNLVINRALVVGGGGAGGSGGGGGGGGGGVWTNDAPIDAVCGATVSVTVGAGGAVLGNGGDSRNENGGASVLTIGANTRQALGGGAGASYNVRTGSNGANGGGGMTSAGVGGQPTDATGHAGGQGCALWGVSSYDWIGGGGGGAGAPGQDGNPGVSPNKGKSGDGGEGIVSDITGTSVVYGSGGGAGNGSDAWVDSGVGGTNAGNGGGKDGVGSDGTSGTPGMGGGGGGASAGYSGGAGGCGTVVLVFYDPPDPELPAAHVSAETSGDHSHTVEVTVDKLGEGASSATVSLAYGLAGGALGAYRTVAENVAEGAAVSCGMTGLYVNRYRYAVKVANDLGKNVIVEGQFQVDGDGYEDDYVCISNVPAGFVPVLVEENARVFVFTDVSQTAEILVKRSGVSIERALVVGGGGSGGITWGGGGGGGGVWTNDAPIDVASGATVSVTVGAGGAAVNGGKKTGDYESTLWNLRGNNGATSQFAIGETTYAAEGGGGGGAYLDGDGRDGANGGGGSNAGKGGSGSATGHDGAKAEAYPSTLLSGGGGGAGADANGFFGGEGIVSDITGTTLTYGSGGGGLNNNAEGDGDRPGGTNAGCGRFFDNGDDAVDGFGGGGGAGGLATAAGCPGGKGGDGTVILRIAVPAVPPVLLPDSLMFAGFGDGGADKQYFKIHADFVTPPADLGSWLADIRNREALVVKCAPTVEALAKTRPVVAAYRDGTGDQDIESGTIWLEVGLPTETSALYYQAIIREGESSDYLPIYGASEVKAQSKDAALVTATVTRLGEGVESVDEVYYAVEPVTAAPKKMLFAAANIDSKYTKIELDTPLKAGDSISFRIPDLLPETQYKYTVLLVSGDDQEMFEGTFETLSAGSQQVAINEFMASNGDTRLTANGKDGLDWIELRNDGDQPEDVSGWYLSDNPDKAESKWKKIKGRAVVPAHGVLVVWADKDYDGFTADEPFVRTGLGKDSGSVFLANPVGEILSRFDYGEQIKDISYGVDTAGNVGHFDPATPGAPNVGNVLAPPTPAVEFDVPHGYKTETFTVGISCPNDENAAIYYTTDGTAPTTASTPYTDRITVDRTTCLRAAVVDARSVLQKDASATYLFLDDVLQQGTTPPEGFPADKAVNGHAMLYGFVGLPAEGTEDRARLLRGMTNSIATMSFVIDPKDLFDESTGIYVNPVKTLEPGHEREWERKVMLEQIDPTDPDNGFTIAAGLRLRGAWSRNNDNPKHAFRLFFRSQYGASSLKFPLFGKEGADKFDKVDLRTSQNYSWASSGIGGETFVHETFARDTQRDMGVYYTRSRYYHLFINGQYWGLYQTQERGDEDFAETYDGGKAENYDVIKTDSSDYQIKASSGTMDAWNQLETLSKQLVYDATAYMRMLGCNSDGSRNADYPVLLNPDNLIAFVLNAHYMVDCDNPVSPSPLGSSVNNLYALRDRVDGDGREGGFFFLRHDAEHSMGTYNMKEYGPYILRYEFGRYDQDPSSYVKQTPFNPGVLNDRLCQSVPDYKMAFADAYYRTCLKPGGALTDEKALARFRSRMAEIDDAIVCEACRWGRCPEKTRETWLANCGECLFFISNRLTYMTQQYRDRGWYPSIDPPTVSIADGKATFAAVYPVYYTLDGSDPRTNGILAPADGVTLPATGTTVIRARCKSYAGEWSALDEAKLDL